MNAPPSIHPSEQILSSYGLGKLDDGTAEAVSQHLKQCPDCRKRVAAMPADSFLDRIRDAQGRPSSLAGLSMMSAGPDSLSPPRADTLPPGLADHPDYNILRELGQGGMGVVYLAENTLMGRKEVLKVVSSQLMNRRGVLDRFLGEIRHAARLHHPNVVTAYSVLRLGESLVLAMEYVEGLDLARLVKTRGPLPVANACNYLHQAALGLQHAHENGMVHRDIKPGNLMLTRQGSRALVKVLDFGLAKVIREGPMDGTLTHEGQMLGTPDYIAPEQIVDARRADIRADIYSLGCTFYYLLTGGPPFQATSLYEIFQAHHSMDAMPLNLVRPEVPVELAALVGKMMAKEPDRRFQEPREVAQALKPFFKAGNVAAIVSKPEVSQANPSAAGRPASGTISTPAQPAADSGGPGVRTKKAAEPTSPEARWESLIDFKESERSSDAVKPKPTPAAGPAPRPPWLTWPAIAATSLFGFIALSIIIYVATDKGRIKIVVDGPQPIVKIDGDTVRIEGLDETITLRTGPHELAVQWGDGETKTQTRVVRRGGNTEWRVEYEPKPGPDKLPVPPVADSKVAEWTGWASLFNGEDLTGWVVDGGDQEAWQVKSGELVVHGAEKEFGGGGQGYLLTEQEYADFCLRFQFRRSSDTAFSGIALRAVPHETNRNSNPDDKGGFPFHLTAWLGKYPAWSNREGEATGTLWWSPDSRAQPPLDPDHLAEVKPIGDWNDMEIEMRGLHLRIAVNGSLVQDVKLNQTRPEKFPAPGLNRCSGRIGFLKRTGEVRFRKIEIRELAGSRVKGVPANSPVTRPIETVTNSIEMKLNLIPAGEFLMGSPDADKDAESKEKPPHLVRITKPFYLGVYEVTLGQFRRFVDEAGYRTEAETDGKGAQGWNEETKKIEQNARFTWQNPGFEQTNDHPVVNVSWTDAVAFAKWLSQKEGKSYRLPTEAEWEYACRAKTTTKYYSGDDPESLAGVGNTLDGTFNVKHPTGQAIVARDNYVFTAPVGRFRPNAFGLYDMHGNVWEWCSDGYADDYYKRSPVDDPPGPSGASLRVGRGAGWAPTGPRAWRSATRGAAPPDYRRVEVGFRLVWDPSATQRSGEQVDLAVRSVTGDRDRRAGWSMLSLGGSLTIRVNGQERAIEPGKALPTEAFQLTHVRLGDQPELTDARLEPLAGLTNLVDLRMSKAPKVTDVGVAHLRNLPRLEALWLDGTGVSDAGLVYVKGLPTLKELGLRGTGVTDAALAHLEGLTQLKLLALGGLRVTDAGLVHLRDLAQLEHLWLEATRVADAGLVHLRGLTKLRGLLLWSTKVTDTGLVHLQNLPQLEGLWLQGTRVTDRGLVDLKGLTQLKSLRLDGSGVTNAGLVHLQGLTQLKELHLKNTNVSAAGAEGFKKTIPTCQIITEPAGTTDLEKWQGTWVEATCEWKGEDVVFNDQRPRWTRTFEGNRSFVRDENDVANYDLTFSLIPGQTPKTIDVHVTQGPDTGQTNVGIYQFDGDNLKICWTRAGQERPTEFTTKRGTGICFQTWKRSP